MWQDHWLFWFGPFMGAIGTSADTWRLVTCTQARGGYLWTSTDVEFALIGGVPYTLAQPPFCPSLCLAGAAFVYELCFKSRKNWENKYLPFTNA